MTHRGREGEKERRIERGMMKDLPPLMQIELERLMADMSHYDYNDSNDSIPLGDLIHLIDTAWSDLFDFFFWLLNWIK